MATLVAAVTFATPAFAQNGGTIKSGGITADARGGKLTTFDDLIPINTIIRRDAAQANKLIQPVQADLDKNLQVKCPPPGGCVIEAEITVQVASTVVDNRIKLCTLLNGKGMADADTCLTADLMPQTTNANGFGKFITAKMPAAVKVNAGQHTLKSVAQVDQAATLGYLYIKYVIYKDVKDLQ